ncbi:hypothetical protein K501DRAFT_36538 [Backusella circina FSU 941]|nr:hypothetical protein K501DRAFT_36538 [Backusella circina FSU 941]
MDCVRSPGSSSESSYSEERWARNVRSSPTEALNMVIAACIYLSVCAPDSLVNIAFIFLFSFSFSLIKGR